MALNHPEAIHVGIDDLPFVDIGDGSLLKVLQVKAGEGLWIIENIFKAGYEVQKHRLAALVPKPRVNLTRYHGVLAPNHRSRGLVTPAKRGKGVKQIANTEVRSPAEHHAAMTWTQRLKRVFSIDI